MCGVPARTQLSLIPKAMLPILAMVALINVTDCSGKTNLHHAAYSGHLDVSLHSNIPPHRHPNFSDLPSPPSPHFLTTSHPTLTPMHPIPPPPYSLNYSGSQSLASIMLIEVTTPCHFPPFVHLPQSVNSFQSPDLQVLAGCPSWCSGMYPAGL